MSHAYNAPAPIPHAQFADPMKMVGGRVKKRVIVCCDGTWQDGIVVKERWKYTNILRLSRTINHEDSRQQPVIPQIVFYQSGIGSENNFYSEYIQGPTGASLAEKVQEGYGFISQNYQPGDEIFLFGFSRGAYTARMIAAFIGAIGVLDRQDMDHFAQVFIDFQKRGKSKDKAEIAQLDANLAPWTAHDSPGKKRADSDKDTFSVKCIGVFDTVGNLGLPEELTMGSQKMTKIFGFSDKLLGEHIEYAFHALALNETRADFNCAKFEQTEGGRRKNQVLKQCWFAGSHADIGGGWEDHDLSDLTLMWMIANISNLLSVDYTYLSTLPQPCYPWGEQPPHDPRTGVFSLTETITRQLLTSTDDVTHETIHPSALRQKQILPQLKANVDNNPALVTELLPFEQEVKEQWPYVPGKNPPRDIKTEENSDDMNKSFMGMAIQQGTQLVQHTLRELTHTEIMKDASGSPVYEKNCLARHADETPFGKYLSEWTDRN
ncbi:hypothetical protein PILCRDRAFT_817818 [Piloderma croceum F 1598]|uniref:T6SS Phospholipase effector Tle1-like catalytic domain-containing protein n=1 Tax=Piloderma croceum (strain F 1598) TaxID=765440 RepID=A0A0C3FZ37_PILCF|nr:hypothetical protein PILCRDRAFT_817818 [Piloderma croceum F 1598]